MGWSWLRLTAHRLISRRASRSWCQGITLSILVLALWSFFCLSTFLFSSCPFSAPPFPVLVTTFPLSSFAFFMLFRLFGCVVLYLGFVMINSCHCLENARYHRSKGAYHGSFWPSRLRL